MSTTVMVDFRTQPGKAQQLASLVQEKAYPSMKAADGFESITMFRVDDNDDRVVEIETWSSWDAYQAWLQPALAELGPSLMDLLTGPPEVLRLEAIASM